MNEEDISEYKLQAQKASYEALEAIDALSREQDLLLKDVIEFRHERKIEEVRSSIAEKV